MISTNLEVNCGQYGYEVCACMCVWCACVCVCDMSHTLIKLSSMPKGWDGFERHWRKQDNGLTMLLDSMSSGI